MMTLEEMKQLQQAEIDWDWEKFRREAAKDLMPMARQMDIGGYPSSIVKTAIGLADELIRQLKEEKNEGK